MTFFMRRECVEALPPDGLTIGAFGIPKSPDFEICGMNSGNRHASRIDPISRSGFPVPRCRGGRKPLDDKHLPLNAVSCPRNSGLLDDLRLHEVITKKSSEIKSFLLVFAQFPVPVLGMFPTRGRCQSVSPFPLTGDFRIPKLNQHCLRLLDTEIENSSGRRNVMDCRKEKNLASRACTYDPCSRKGICCECVEYHVKNRQLPGCCFPKDAERTYNRSFEHFAKLVTEKRV